MKPKTRLSSLQVGTTKPNPTQPKLTHPAQEFLLSILKQPSAKAGDHKELQKMAAILSLNNLALGSVHYEAATVVYKNHVLWTSSADLEDENSADRKAVDRMIYLSDRVFKLGGETDEAYRYEMGRISRVSSN